MVDEYNQKIYHELLDRIIEVEKDLYGELAVKVASGIKELEISGNGKVVKISGVPEDAIRNLLHEYEVLGGKLSKHLNEAVLEAYRKQYPHINFPGGANTSRPFLTGVRAAQSSRLKYHRLNGAPFHTRFTGCLLAIY
jgi:hypothetical protein